MESISLNYKLLFSREKLQLSKPDDYRYLAGCTQYFSTPTSDKQISNSQKSKDHISRGPLKDPILDDLQDFKDLDQALARLGLTDSQKFEIYGLVAAVLHLGNVSFEDNPEDAKGGCRVSQGSEKALTITAKLIGCDPFELRQALVSRVMLSKGGGIKGTVIMVSFEPL